MLYYKIVANILIFKCISFNFAKNNLFKFIILVYLSYVFLGYCKINIINEVFYYDYNIKYKHVVFFSRQRCKLGI